MQFIFTPKPRKKIWTHQPNAAIYFVPPLTVNLKDNGTGSINDNNKRRQQKWLQQQQL